MGKFSHSCNTCSFAYGVVRQNLNVRLTKYELTGENRKFQSERLRRAMILLAVPLTIFVGVTYFEDKKYLFISLLVMLECYAAFFLVFEGRKPQARELVIIALCAIAVVGRTAFYFFAAVQACYCNCDNLGNCVRRKASLVGSTDNAFVKHNAWAGPVDSVADVCRRNNRFFGGSAIQKRTFLPQQNTALRVRFVATVVIYGVIMNISSAVMAHAPMNFETITTYLALGFPFDIVHGLSTVAFLFFGAEPILEKLDRVKTKYGLLSV